jgi:predicted membrane protein
LFGGLLIIALGLVFLLDNLGIVESRSVLGLWPLLLVFAGLKHLFDARRGGAAVTAVLLASAGCLLLLNNLNVIDFRFRDLWPFFLIGLGLHILMRSFASPAGPKDDVDTDATIASFALLGGVKKRSVSPAFQGGSVSAYLGGVEIDLRQVQMQGESVVIDVSAMMGGIELRIPESWTLDLRVSAILGGVDDKTIAPSDAGKRLVLRGSVVMGGIEVSN